MDSRAPDPTGGSNLSHPLHKNVTFQDTQDEGPSSDTSSEDLWALVRQYKALKTRKQELLADGQEDEASSEVSDISQLSLINDQLEALAALDTQNAADWCYVPGATSSSSPVETFLDNIEQIEVRVQKIALY